MAEYPPDIIRSPEVVEADVCNVFKYVSYLYYMCSGTYVHYGEHEEKYHGR